MWHDVWVQSGIPRQGHIANMKIKSRLKYHYAIRHVSKETTKWLKIFQRKITESFGMRSEKLTNLVITYLMLWMESLT